MRRQRIAHSSLFASGVTLLTAPFLGAQQRPAITPVSAVTASSTESLGAISNIRALPGGRVLVNDAASRRVLLLDSALKTVSVVADSTPSTANAYGPRSGALIAYRGDSTLFVDAASLSMLVIDGNGKIARVMSIPRSQDAGMLTGTVFNGAAYDGAGHLVYRGAPNVQMRMNAGAANASGSIGAPTVADTMALVRVELATRKVDTVGFVKIPKTNTQVMRGEDGSISVNIEVNPLPVVDDWAMRSDGTIGILRGKDYHVDWMAPDGTRSSSPKINFDWRRLTDEQKAEFLDSVKVQRERMMAALPPEQRGMAAIGSVLGGGGGGAPAGGAGPNIRFQMNGGPPGGGPPGGGAPGAGGPPGGMGAMPGGMPKMNVTYVAASELPDYQPPFFTNSVKADEDGNIWVRTIPTKTIPGGAVYDLINKQGEVTRRVQLPADRTLVGFGSGGTVFLSARDGNSTRLERASFK